VSIYLAAVSSVPDPDRILTGAQYDGFGSGLGYGVDDPVAATATAAAAAAASAEEGGLL